MGTEEIMLVLGLPALIILGILWWWLAGSYVWFGGFGIGLAFPGLLLLIRKGVHEGNRFIG